MCNFRTLFPNESITPKLHLLEYHVVPFIERWRYGFGLYGEQGIESVHQSFNKLSATYCRMKPNVRRLKSMMDAHMISVNPESRTLKPPIKKRKFKNEQ